MIRQSVGSAAALTRQLLIISRQGESRREPLDVCKAVGALKPLLLRIVREDIELACDVAPNAGRAIYGPGRRGQSRLLPRLALAPISQSKRLDAEIVPSARNYDVPLTFALVGRENRNVEPTPSLLSTATSPP